MYSHNYKGLPYKQSIKRFVKDYRIRYFLYGKYSKWKTSRGEKIMVKDISYQHLINIVNYFGNTKIRTDYPFVWYRYLNEVVL